MPGDVGQRSQAFPPPLRYGLKSRALLRNRANERPGRDIMCTLPHHAGCSRDGADGTNRRGMLKWLTAMGVAAPLATHILDRAAVAGSISFLDRAELVEGLTALIAR